MEGFSVSHVSKAGSADGGQFVHFELVDPSGNGMRFLVPFQKMNMVLLSLYTAMEMAFAENSSRPGFDPSQFSARLGVASYQLGHAVAPSQESMVVLEVQTKREVRLGLMLSEDQAKELGRALTDAADFCVASAEANTFIVISPNAPATAALVCAR